MIILYLNTTTIVTVGYIVINLDVILHFLFSPDPDPLVVLDDHPLEYYQYFVHQVFHTLHSDCQF